MNASKNTLKRFARAHYDGWVLGRVHYLKAPAKYYKVWSKRTKHLRLSKEVEQMPFGEIVCNLLNTHYKNGGNYWVYRRYVDGDFIVVMLWFGPHDGFKVPVPPVTGRQRTYDHIDGFDVLVIRDHINPRNWTAWRAVKCFKQTFAELKKAGH